MAGSTYIWNTNNKFGLNILPASVKFIQCQSVLRNALKSGGVVARPLAFHL